MRTYMPLDTNDVNSGDTSEMNALGTSEMNVLNAIKVNVLSLLCVLSCTSCISNLLLPLG